MKEYAKWGISELRKRLDQREISARELTQYYLNRIKQYNPLIKSFITVTEEWAYKQADGADKRIRQKESRKLEGIPIAVKDNICTKEIRTTCASKMLADFIPPYDASAVSKLYEQGAVLLGKNNMDEFAMGSASNTSAFGVVRNPYDTDKIAGGSSGGGAAGVAMGLTPAALGSDTGGSVRQPAALCGITGFKPTYGAVSRYGLIAFASSLDQIGILSRTAKDCACLLSIITGKDSHDMTTARNTTKYAVLQRPDLKKTTVGLPRELLEEGIDQRIRKTVLDAVRWYEKNGCRIETVSLPALRYAVPAYYLLSSAEAASNLARYDGVRYGKRAESANGYEELVEKSRTEGFGKEVKRRILLGNYALSSGYYDQYYIKAVSIRRHLTKQLEDLFKTCDFLISPTVPAPARRLDEPCTPAQIYKEDLCTVPANLAGLPAISTPCGYDKDGMPVSMSILGPRFSDGRLLGMADLFEGSFVRKECF